MLASVLSCFGLALLAPWIYKLLPKKSGWLLAALPAGLAIYFLGLLSGVGGTLREVTPWFPGLSLQLSFVGDSLSLLFTLIITVIGAIVIIYAGGYLEKNDQLGRFYAFILFFMGSMLGLVLSDNVISLFIFWELTSFSSYLLIGFNHEREGAREAALQALLVTGIGGLALLAGLLLISQVTGTFEISEILKKGGVITTHSLFVPILILILAGAFTKSAQFPFHFWLPNAMEAPTPASTYLHAATMVKAGIYLLARFSPVFQGEPLWAATLTLFGGITMFLGSYLAFQSTAFKKVLAYSTVSALGTFVMLIGLGTKTTFTAMLLLLVAHAAYKGTLFLVAGIIDHKTGQKEMSGVGGLFSKMPVVAVASILASFAMAGFPPFLNFFGKETMLSGILEHSYHSTLILSLTSVSLLLNVAVSLNVGVRPFFGIKKNRGGGVPKISMELGPVLLSLAGLFILPTFFPKSLGIPHLTYWHGWNSVAILSLGLFLFGTLLFWKQQGLKDFHSLFKRFKSLSANSLYNYFFKNTIRLAKRTTTLLQGGYLRSYLSVVLGTTSLLLGYTLYRYPIFLDPPDWSNIHFYEWGIALLIVLATLAAVQFRSRLGAVASLGVVGYSVALLFLFYGAPDLAMTQFVIETLTVVLFVLVFYHLPYFRVFARRRSRARDLSISLFMGGIMTFLVLVATNLQYFPTISDFFAERSFLEGHGRNIVNVILVDFRGMDTLGEITVLGLAGIGVFSLLKLKLGETK